MQRKGPADRAAGARNDELLGGGVPRFNGRVAVVTGSTADPSIGRSCAIRLAREGASVVVNGRDKDRVASTEAALRSEGLDVVGFCGSMDTEPAVASLTDRAIEAFGRIDLIVSTIGGAPYPLSFEAISESQLVETLRLNTWPAVALIRAAIAKGLGDDTGSVVTISSGSPYKTTSTMVSLRVRQGSVERNDENHGGRSGRSRDTSERRKSWAGADHGDPVHLGIRRRCGGRIGPAPWPADRSRGHRRRGVFPSVRRRTTDHRGHPRRRRGKPPLGEMDAHPVKAGCELPGLRLRRRPDVPERPQHRGANLSDLLSDLLGRHARKLYPQVECIGTDCAHGRSSS